MFKMQVNDTEWNFRNYTIQWRMLKFTNVSHKLLCNLVPFQRDKKIPILNLQKSMSRSTISAITSFDGKCQNLQMSPHFCTTSSMFQRYKNVTYVTSKKQVKVTECNFVNLTLSDITILKFDIKKIKITACTFHNYTI